MYEVQKSAEFSAAHTLRDYEGPCARNHGHNYRVEVVVRGEKLDPQRLLIDFADLDRILAPLVARLDHQNLNEIAPFDRVNPTAEAIAEWFYRGLVEPVTKATGGRARLGAVRLWETPDSWVVYSED
jgi:6-pyruvoyltetrahydropterin/6-carboxytetrahydropterin synthase